MDQRNISENKDMLQPNCSENCRSDIIIAVLREIFILMDNYSKKRIPQINNSGWRDGSLVNIPSTLVEDLSSILTSQRAVHNDF